MLPMYFVCLVLTKHKSVSLFRFHSDGAVSNNGPSPDKESGRRRGPPRSRQQPQRAGGNGGGGDTDSPRSKRRTSLRIGTGRKGRGAELSQRRGSLKKRDRRAEKEARAEAAVERKTVELPEYVIECGA